MVIDAGHGGKDPGNLGTGRYKEREKDIALAVALKLGNYITENFPDVKVVYTRKTDVFIELNKRTQIANAAQADLFISIHCDAFTSSGALGSTSFVMGRNHGDENMRVAKQENSVILLEENYEENYAGFDPSKPETYIALSMMQNAFLNQSISFAQKVQDQFRDRVNRRDRGVKQQPLYVTSRTVMPAVLIELGFLTNPAEEDFLNSGKGQDYMASAIFRAFREYKEEREKYLAILHPAQGNPASSTTELSNSEKTEIQKSIETTTPQNEEDLHKIYFTVQFATSAIEKEPTSANFKGISGVDMYKDGFLFKYTSGKFQSLSEAEQYKKQLQTKGYGDAFVIAFSDDKRISIKEAGELLQ